MKISYVFNNKQGKVVKGKKTQICDYCVTICCLWSPHVRAPSPIYLRKNCPEDSVRPQNKSPERKHIAFKNHRHRLQKSTGKLKRSTRWRVGLSETCFDIMSLWDHCCCLLLFSLPHVFRIHTAECPNHIWTSDVNMPCRFERRVTLT